MPTWEEFFAAADAPAAPRTWEDFFAEQDKVGKFERGLTQAKARTADISQAGESGAAAALLPGVWLGSKVREALYGGEDPADAKRAEWQQAAQDLPEAQTFGDKAADFVGRAVPDFALGAATLPIAGAGMAAAEARGAGTFLKYLAGEAAQSAALAPVEFGTRDPAEAALITATAPVAGAVIGKGLGALGSGLGRMFGRGAGEAVGEVAPRRVPAWMQAEDTPRFNEAGAPRIAEGSPVQFNQEDLRLFRPKGPAPPPKPPRPEPAWMSAEETPLFNEVRTGPFSESVTGFSQQDLLRQLPPGASEASGVRIAARQATNRIGPQGEEIVFEHPSGGLLGAVFQGDRAFVADVLVPQELRRQGIGTSLYEALGSEMRRRGISKIEGNVVGESADIVQKLRGRALAPEIAEQLIADAGPDAAQKPLGQLLKESLQLQKVETAQAIGRAVSVGDVIATGNRNLATEASASVGAIQQATITGLKRSGMPDEEARAFATQVADLAHQMDPKMNAQLAEAMQDMTPQGLDKFVRLFKNMKGVCPL